MTDKAGILFLLKYLYDHTDCDRTLTLSQLQKKLNEAGYSSDPRTIRKDLEIMNAVGFDVVIEPGDKPGSAKRYSYGNREWTTEEIQVLIDAVSSAQFITREKTDDLIRKLIRLAGSNDREFLKPDLYVAEHVKAENVSMLPVINRIHDAIRRKKKVTFQMLNYNTEKRKILRHGGEVYVVSPFHLIWMDDRYYLRGWSDKREKPVTMRIDRITNLEVSDEDAFVPEDMSRYNARDYADQVTRMYGDPDHAMEVILRCHSNMVDNVIDRFGPSVSIFNVTPETFDVSLHVAVSGTFLSWLFQFAGSMFIVSPEPARQMYADMLTFALNDMQGGTFRMSESSKWIL